MWHTRDLEDLFNTYRTYPATTRFAFLETVPMIKFLIFTDGYQNAKKIAHLDNKKTDRYFGHPQS